MKNIEDFEDLGWTEASLENIRYKNGCLSFVMTDLISYAPKTSFEYVNITIKEIKYLDVLVDPFVNGK